jgi:hypothetical protein
MCLKKILLQLLGENSRDTIDDGVPGVFCGDDSIVYVSAFFFEYSDIEWLVRNWIGQVLQMISSHRVFQGLQKKEPLLALFIISQPFSMSFFP